MAEFDAPQSRNEAILQNILGADNVLLPPQSRNEAILQNILGADNVLLPPQSRIEELLMQLLEEWPVGPQEVPENDVTFYDYDGSIVASYTAAQFAELEEMPENPDHTDEGLTSQGWNWSLANAKAYVAKYGKLNVGQMYVPTDGKTHVFINIPEDDPSYETTLYFGHTTESGQTVIDWGDGSPTETFSGTTATEHSHTYANPGKYEITLNTSGTMTVSGTSNGRTGTHFSGAGNCARNLTRIEEICFSTNVSIESNAFAYCYALQSVTVPDGVTSIGTYAFAYCYALQSVIIPDGVTSIGTGVFYYCYGMHAYHFNPKTPPTITNTNVFSGISTDTKMYVPSESLETYKTAQYWSTYADRMVGE